MSEQYRTREYPSRPRTGSIEPEPVESATDNHSQAPHPSAHDLSDLQSLTHPAVYQLPATLDILASNTAFQRWFPGTQPGSSMLEWMMLEPAARWTFPEWTTDARRLVTMFRTLSRDFADEKRVADIVAKCASAPEWDEMWSTPAAVTESPGAEPVVVRDPITRRTRTMLLRIYAPELPARPWRLCRLVPHTGR